jgi:hypothetical protein
MTDDTRKQLQPEMKVVERLVGTWKSENVLKTAPATHTPSTGVSKTTLILGGHFTENRNYDNDGALRNINILADLSPTAGWPGKRPLGRRPRTA